MQHEILNYNNIEEGLVVDSPEYHVSEREIIEFATRWDPQRFHLDREAAKLSMFNRLVACGTHINCIRGLLHHRLPKQVTILAGLGAESMVLPNPVYPGDRLRLTEIFMEKRLSNSLPNRGIISSKHVVKKQDGKIVLSLIANVLVSARE